MKTTPVLPSKNKLADAGVFSLFFGLSEAKTDDSNGPDGKPKHEIVLTALQEGPGNLRDKRWYTREAVINAEPLFRARKKLFVNHIIEGAPVGSDNLRDWCATMKDTWIEEDKATGRVKRQVRLKIHEEWLWTRCLEAPEEIALSIEGQGAGKETMIEGQKFMAIEKIWSLSATKFVTYPGNAKMGADLVEGAVESPEEMPMDFKLLTRAALIDNRPDLVTEIETAAVAPLTAKLTEAEAATRAAIAAKPGAAELAAAAEAAVKPLKESFTATLNDLSEKNKELARKLDGHEIRASLRDRKVSVDALIEASKLPAQAKTPRFVERCYAIVERKVGDKILTVEEQVQAEIAEQLKLVTEEFGSIRPAPAAAAGDVLNEEEQQIVFNRAVFHSGPTLEEFRAEKAKAEAKK